MGLENKNFGGQPFATAKPDDYLLTVMITEDGENILYVGRVHSLSGDVIVPLRPQVGAWSIAGFRNTPEQVVPSLSLEQDGRLLRAGSYGFAVHSEARLVWQDFIDHLTPSNLATFRTMVRGLELDLDREGLPGPGALLGSRFRGKLDGNEIGGKIIGFAVSDYEIAGVGSTTAAPTTVFVEVENGTHYDFVLSPDGVRLLNH